MVLSNFTQEIREIVDEMRFDDRGDASDAMAWPFLWRGIKIIVDAVTDARRGGLHGIAGEMGVPGGRLHLGVAEQFADHREPFAKRQGPGREAMAKVMDADVVEFGTRPDAAPWVLEVGEVAAGLLAGDYPRVVLFARQRFQQPHRRGCQRHGASAGLGVGQAQLARLQIDMLPT